MSRKLSRYILCYVLPAAFCFPLQSQTQPVKLDEVTIRAYLRERPVLNLPASVAVVDSAQLSRQSGQSLLPALNSVAGVRMEERSPGSYRLSVRGSLLRSPFGVRNTRLYLDEFPLTNAGGEAYLNIIDPNSLASVEVLKGPDGSLFGANSGGVVRLGTYSQQYRDSSYGQAGISAGSYGLFQENALLQQRIGRSVFSLNEGWQRADGYRQNSAMDRKFVQLGSSTAYNPTARVGSLFFYSDHTYQTPGGLTLAQFRQDPRQARPATATLPGAAEQQAAVRNRTFFGGIYNDAELAPRARHYFALFGSHTLFENPFITNYEVRDESNLGARTWLELKNRADSGIALTWNLGAEIQSLWSEISNYGNNRGCRDSLQAKDFADVTQGFVFTRFTAGFYNKWLLEGSLSYNYNRLAIRRLQPASAATNRLEKTPQPELMPRLSASYLFTRNFSWRAIVSRGYSPPSLQEIRASDNSINLDLQAESGWNYETGFRLRSASGLLWWDVSAFYYRLNHAIVRRVNSAGQEYFVNSGGTEQPGLESQLTLKLIKPRERGLVRGLEVYSAATYYRFRFRNYGNGNTDFSGNSLTGVPLYVFVTGLQLSLPYGFYIFAQHNYTERIALNDLNSEYAAAYDLVQLKAGWRFRVRQLLFDVNAGVDNLLDETYSLGNDLNALGARYYNAAPGRNYFVKLKLAF